jgi:hypothetical protein
MTSFVVVNAMFWRCECISQAINIFLQLQIISSWISMIVLTKIGPSNAICCLPFNSILYLFCPFRPPLIESCCLPKCNKVLFLHRRCLQLHLVFSYKNFMFSRILCILFPPRNALVMQSIFSSNYKLLIPFGFQ